MAGVKKRKEWKIWRGPREVVAGEGFPDLGLISQKKKRMVWEEQGEVLVIGFLSQRRWTLLARLAWRWVVVGWKLVDWKDVEHRAGQAL